MLRNELYSHNHKESCISSKTMKTKGYISSFQHHQDLPKSSDVWRLEPLQIIRLKKGRDKHSQQLP